MSEAMTLNRPDRALPKIRSRIEKFMGYSNRERILIEHLEMIANQIPGDAVADCEVMKDIAIEAMRKVGWPE